MTGTFAGQYVTEGFFGNIFRKDWHRVATTRGISLVPSMLVAIFAVDHFDNMGELLNVLQSVCLPPVLIPILKLCSSTAVMSAEFTTSTVMHIICWLLTAVVVGFNCFLFISHISSWVSFMFIGLFGVIYLVSNLKGCCKKNIDLNFIIGFSRLPCLASSGLHSIHI